MKNVKNVFTSMSCYTLTNAHYKKHIAYVQI